MSKKYADFMLVRLYKYIFKDFKVFVYNIDNTNKT